MNAKTALLTAAAVSGLMMGSAHAEGKKNHAKMSGNDVVKCYGVNSCKGKGICAGKVDACSGANGCDAKVTCKGHNSCKGKGIIKMKKKECVDKGGKVAS